MKRISYVLVVSLFAVLVSSPTLSAQSYSGSLGLRLGGYNGITYKGFINENSAIEVFGTFRSYSLAYTFLTATGLYEIHNAIPNVDGLKWYYGGGATAGFFSYQSSYTGSSTSTIFGITGVVGLEYVFKDVPINVSLDWAPTYYLNSGFGFSGDYFALSGRYIFGRK